MTFDLYNINHGYVIKLYKTRQHPHQGFIVKQYHHLLECQVCSSVVVQYHKLIELELLIFVLV